MVFVDFSVGCSISVVSVPVLLFWMFFYGFYGFLLVLDGLRRVLALVIWSKSHLHIELDSKQRARKELHEKNPPKAGTTWRRPKALANMMEHLLGFAASRTLEK